MTSKRKTDSAIAFYNNERIYEQDALYKRSRSPRTTFIFLQKFLGAVNAGHPSFEIARKYYEEYL